MAESVPWYYMWSENYRFFYEMMKDSVKEPNFQMCPIEIPQSQFDSELYQTEGKHFWHGSLIKVNTILDCLKKAKEEGKPYILFTDIDIIVKPGVYADLEPYMKEGVDMVFLKEGSTVNIGFMLFRVCEEVVNFWKEVSVKMVEKHEIDQLYVNQMLPSYSGKYAIFNDKAFTLSNMWDGTTEYKVLQLLCSCLGKEYNMAEKIFNAAQHIDVQPYMKYVNQEIIPYIYEFQDFLHRKYQESRNQAAVNS